MSYPNVPISFPGLFGDWQFTADGLFLDIGKGVYWYGVLLAAGLMLGLFFAMRQAPKYGLKSDDVLDMVLESALRCEINLMIPSSFVV